MTTTTGTLTVQEILLGAADRILRVGLHQADFFPNGWQYRDPEKLPCCADAAIRLTVGMGPSAIMEDDPAPAAVIEAEELLAEHLIRLGLKECRDQHDDLDAVETIGTWNDIKGMTASEVAEILRDVAEQAS